MKNFLAVRKFWLVVVMGAGVFFGLGMVVGRSGERVPRAGESGVTAARQISSTPEPTKGVFQVEYAVPKVVPAGWEVLTLKNESYERRTYAEGVVWNTSQYLLPGRQTVILPGLLGDYDFVSINNYGGYDGPGEMGLSVETFGYREPFYSNYVRGVLYSDGKGVWLMGEVLTVVPRRDVESKPIVLAHASSKMRLEKMIRELGEFENVGEPPDEDTEMNSLATKKVAFPANQTDKSGKYRYYKPAGYEPVSSAESHSLGGSETLERGTGESMCLAFKEVANDPCMFSTSGCTCCNTGCEFLDAVIYETQSGKTQVQTLLQKGTVVSGGARFVYETENPNIYYYTSFYAPDNMLKRGVLDLIHAVESVRRRE